MITLHWMTLIFVFMGGFGFGIFAWAGFIRWSMMEVMRRR